MYYPYYRHPRTTQERRANGTRKDREASQWRRAKRSASQIPNAWDDISVYTQKSWKKKRKTQYNPNSRGERYVIKYSADEVDSWYTVSWAYQSYFSKHDIPFRIVRKKRKIRYTRVQTHERVEWFRTWNHRYHWWDKTYKEVLLDTPIIHNCCRTVDDGIEIYYWTNKKLDLSRINQGYMYD